MPHIYVTFYDNENSMTHTIIFNIRQLLSTQFYHNLSKCNKRTNMCHSYQLSRVIHFITQSIVVMRH